MTQRRNFLRNITMAIAASLLPKILQPCVPEVEEELVTVDFVVNVYSYGVMGELHSVTYKQEPVHSVGDDAEHIFDDAIGCTSYSDVLILDEGIEWVKVARKTFKAT